MDMNKDEQVPTLPQVARAAMDMNKDEQVPDKDAQVGFSLSPETTYAWAMRLMLFGFLVSGALTFGFVKPDMSKDPILKVYGAVNACITFDYSPAREFMCVAFVFICALMMLHVALFVQRLRVFYGPDAGMVRAGYVIGPLYAAMFSTMAISMVQRPSESIMAHTVPYQVLIVGTCIWCVFNAVVIQTWPNRLAASAKIFWWGATVAFLLISAMKIYVQHVLMRSHHDGWTEDEVNSYIPFPASLLDPLWMVLFVFYRYWHPLSNKRVLIQFSNRIAEREVGEAKFCCLRIAANGAITRRGG